MVRRFVETRSSAMGLFFYFVMFVVTCFFGWWVKSTTRERP
jgi:hypothetical protein